MRDPTVVLQSSSEDQTAADKSHNIASDPFTSDGGDLIFGVVSSNENLRLLHPTSEHAWRLWRTFLDNVNPLVKIVHVPSVQKLFMDPIAFTLSKNNSAEGTEALIFSVYSCAVLSLENAECESMFGEKRSTLLAKYQLGTKQALIRAGFLKSSDLIVLQAFVLFLVSFSIPRSRQAHETVIPVLILRYQLSIRSTYDSRSMWTLTGIALRIGQRIGLHRDGSVLQLPPFEVEMRRRLWWQIVLIDSRTAQLSGQGTSVLTPSWDTKLPLNINDADIYPGMTKAPVEHTGPTEMILCLMRYQLGEFLRSLKISKASSSTLSSLPFDGGWQGLTSPTPSRADKDQAIEEFTKILEDKFLKYCDPLDPVQFMTSFAGRAIISSTIFRTHHPRHSADGGAQLPQEEKDMLFATAVRIIEYDGLQSLEPLKRFRWHVKNYFQWDVFLYMLNELRFRTTGEQVEKAWRLVGRVFESHPEILTQTKVPFHVAVGNLTIKAWEERKIKLEQHAAHQNTTTITTTLGKDPPPFLKTLYSQRKPPPPPPPPQNQPSESTCPIDTTFTQFGNTASSAVSQATAAHDPYNQITKTTENSTGGVDPQLLSWSALPGDLNPIDWEKWDVLLQDLELYADYFGEQPSVLNFQD